MKKISKEQLDKLIHEVAINIYMYGSYVYGTENAESDHDFIFIVADDYDKNFLDFSEDSQVEYDNTQCTVYTESEFRKKLENCDVDALECYFLPDAFKAKETIKYEINIDREKVYRNFSQIASNSWVKCKKKLEVEFEYRIGKKSLWHAIRILTFAKQILKTGKINNYFEASHLYFSIVDNPENDYKFYKDHFQIIYNNLKGEVKRLFYCADFGSLKLCSKYNKNDQFCQECLSRQYRTI